MTLKDLSDYLLELLEEDPDLAESEVYVYSSDNTVKDIYHAEMGFENDDNVIPKCMIHNYNNCEIQNCLVLFDHEVEFCEDDIPSKPTKTLAGLLGFKNA